MPVHPHTKHALPLTHTSPHARTHLDISYLKVRQELFYFFVVDWQSGQPEDGRGRVHGLLATTRDRDGGPLNGRRGWGYFEF